MGGRERGYFRDTLKDIAREMDDCISCTLFFHELLPLAFVLVDDTLFFIATPALWSQRAVDRYIGYNLESGG